MTVEAALVLPLFLFCMTALIQYGSVMGTAVQIGTALTETGKSMATAAYAMKYGGEGSAPGLGVSALSAGYAHHKVIGRAGNTDRIKNVNMALSSFLQEEEQIDLVMTYQIKTPVAVIKRREIFSFSVPVCGPGQGAVHREETAPVPEMKMDREKSM